jgi:small-conductance mechanosensitive channel
MMARLVEGGPGGPTVESGGLVELAIGWMQALLGPYSERPWVLALATVFLSLLLAKLLDVVLTLVLKTVAKRTNTLFDDRLFELIHRPVIVSVVLLGALTALRFLELGVGFEARSMQFGMSILILVWAVFFLRAAASFLRAASQEDARFQLIEPRTFPLFSNLATLGVLAMAAWCLIGVWGASMTGWLASAGVAGLAIGFAAQDTLANLFAGVFVIADAPFRVDDYIVLDTGDRGRVVNIGLRSTRLLTRDDVEITIPNSVIANGRVTNQSSGVSKRMRLKVPVQVAYGTDVDELRELLMEIAIEEPLVLASPEPRVRFRLLADSGLNFELMIWVADPSLKGRATDALNTSIYKRLGQAKIEIPYPKQDIYIKRG